MSVYFAGRGLACALGLDVAASVAALDGDAPVRMVDLDDFGRFPYRPIPFDMAAWYARARTLIERVVAEAGGNAVRHAPLLVASSSLDVGAAEANPADFIPDCTAFAQRIAEWLDWRGPVFAVATACTSSINAILAARDMIDAGSADDALVLGVELGNTFTLRGFAAMQLLAPSRAQPFGATRNGLVLGEAVAALRLSRTHSRWRLAGGANVVDGTDPAGASHEAVCAMAQRTLADAGVDAASVSLIKAQAAGSPGNDATEAHALRSVFGPDVAVTSFKHVMGHTLGASGAAELALLTASIEGGVLPRADYAFDDALGCALAEHLPRSRYVLVDILGFGGGHAAVLLQDCEAPDA
ncbi:beta-ketoacyl synthase N-terminal-like domain-containing protein [Uliginosibacterium sp. sgz301328]|uniref:beta-ketoacyl synthase N-terminal-like domain-containing protein n=1 Tax=Uliginosibacterium sp. sgz301328 TaxID=3243764 RepID=UPI00359E181A